MDDNKDIAAPVQMFHSEPFESDESKVEPGDLIYYIEKLTVMVAKHGQSVSATGWIVGFQCTECGSILVSYKNLKLHEIECGHTATSVSDAPQTLTTKKQLENNLDCFENQEQHLKYDYFFNKDLNSIMPKSSKKSLSKGKKRLKSQNSQQKKVTKRSLEHYGTEHNYTEETDAERMCASGEPSAAVQQFKDISEAPEGTLEIANLQYIKVEENVSSESCAEPFVVEQSPGGFEVASAEQDNKQNLFNKSTKDHFKSKKKRKLVRTRCDCCDKMFFSVKSLEVHMPCCHAKCKTVDKDETYPEETNSQIEKPSNGGVQCIECHKYFSSPGMLKRHLIVHFKEIDFTCNVCSHVFACKSSLQRHEKICGSEDATTSEMEEVKVQCSACNEQFSSRSGFLEHTCTEELEGKSTGKMQYVCVFCNRAYALKGGLKHLRNHIRKHTGINEVPTCDKCGKTYSVIESYRKHIKSCGLSDNEKYMYRCTFCPKAFKTQIGVLNHERIHRGEVLHKCEICGKHYLNKHNLNVHKKTAHLGERPFMCSECGKCFSQRSVLNVHLKVHEGKREYTCELCGKDFNLKGQLGSHKKIVHSDVRNYQCQQCPKAFKIMSKLKRHEFTHTGLRPYQCIFCSMSFKTKYNLTEHEGTHTGFQQFECSVCDQKFGVLSDMIKHRESHLIYLQEESTDESINTLVP